MAVYSAALVKGSVGIPKAFRIYAADGDGVYYETELAYEEGSGEFGVYKQDLTVLTLETPVVTTNVRLVMDCGNAAWVFLSEVEFFEQKDAEKTLDIEALVQQQQAEKEAEESRLAEESRRQNESAAAESSAPRESSGAASASNAAVSDPGFSIADEGDGLGGGTIALIVGAAVIIAAAVIAVICKKKKN